MTFLSCQSSRVSNNRWVFRDWMLKCFQTYLQICSKEQDVNAREKKKYIRKIRQYIKSFFIILYLHSNQNFSTLVFDVTFSSYQDCQLLKCFHYMILFGCLNSLNLTVILYIYLFIYLFIYL